MCRLTWISNNLELSRGDSSTESGPNSGTLCFVIMANNILTVINTDLQIFNYLEGCGSMKKPTQGEVNLSGPKTQATMFNKSRRQFLIECKFHSKFFTEGRSRNNINSGYPGLKYLMQLIYPPLLPRISAKLSA